MILTSLLLFGALVSTSGGQSFEPGDFNVTKALQEKGVNISAIPELTQLRERSSSTGCSIACNSLKLLYGSDRVITEGALGYDAFTGSYWSSIQESLNPFCVVQPASNLDVSVAVLISRLTGCPFAAKSGGHAAFGGASSIEGGITISFELMRTIKLSFDQKTASVEPGNRWGDVYQNLNNTNLAVIGGRVFNIGIGGLTLGGGISFFSNIYGWACDNVKSYDVVTASGRIINASPSQFSDLYWALRGGGNNLGLVVNFNLNTISLPGQSLWGGTRVHTEATFPAVARAFSNLVANSPTDPNAGHWVAWGSINGTKLAIPELYYANPHGDVAPIFHEYNAIEAVSDSTGVRTLAQYAETNQQSNPNGLREVYWGLTVKLDQTLADEAKDIFFEEIAAISDVEGVNPFMIYQGITTGQISNMSKNGGNPLGIKLSDGPLYLIHVSCMWQNESDDSKVYATVSKVLTRLSARAEAIGKMNDYIYMNYASQFEDVISSYGASNKARLKSIAEKYDPTAVFQTLQPGYFKLDHAPVPNSGYYSGM